MKPKRLVRDADAWAYLAGALLGEVARRYGEEERQAISDAATVRLRKYMNWTRKNELGARS